MDVNDARIHTKKAAQEFADRQVKNGYDIVIIAYDDRPKFVEWDRRWLVIYG